MKRYIASVLIPCLLMQFAGCYTMQLSQKEELANTKEFPSIIVMKYDKQNYLFESSKYVIQNDSIIGNSWLLLENNAKVSQDTRKISLGEISSVKISKFDTIGTATYVIVCVGLAVLIGYGIKSLMENTTENIARKVGEGLGNFFK